MKNSGFTSWRDESLEIKVKFTDSDTLQTGVEDIMRMFPELGLTKLRGNKIKVTCKNASQVFWVKNHVTHVGGSI